MWEIIYDHLLIITIVITLVFGLALLFLKVPKNERLKNYRLFRIVMGCHYLFLCIANILEIGISPKDIDIQLIRCLVLSIGSLLAFTMTFSYIALINPGYITLKRILKNAINIVIIISSLFFAYFFPEDKTYFNAVFSFIAVYYSILLIWYTRLFIKIYKEYRFKVDNFYMEENVAEMQWVYVSFITSLFLGIFSLVSAIFAESMIVTVLFNAYIGIFYTFYGIRFINYAFQFQLYIEPVLSEEKTQETTIVEDNTQYTLLQKNICDWTKNENYLQTGLTLGELAKQLKTNRTYLSAFINETEHKTFREWIHDLRIEKSKEIMLEFPKLSIAEISVKVGYNDGSNFNKQFVKKTGISAQTWRMEHSL